MKGRKIREWERRWREVGDIMNEEDVMETSIMHLCIPDYEEKRKPRMIIPSGCSYNAVSILLNEISYRECTYHFPVYSINDQPSNVVLIRNLSSGFDLRWGAEAAELKSMIKNVCKTVSIDHSHGVVRVTYDNSEDASRVAERLNGWELAGSHLSLTQGKREDECSTISLTGKTMTLEVENACNIEAVFFPPIIIILENDRVRSPE